MKVIKTSNETNGKCSLTNGRFLIEINGNHEVEVNRMAVKKALGDWYLERAETKIKERVDRFSQQIGKRPVSIEIKNQERRWGSCSHNGTIRFNWKIIMAPISVMDYVIVHEIYHLIYPHHSPRFWQKVQSIIPDYKRRRELLKSYSLKTDNLNYSLTPH